MSCSEGARLSLATCRRLLGSSGAHLTDADVGRLRDQMYELAGSIVAAYNPHQKLSEDAALRLVPPNDRDDIEERAAILEFEAQMTRDAATRVAMAAYLRSSGPLRAGGSSR